MLENFNTNTEMQYQRLSAEEQSKRGILGRLVGVIADFKHPTRNGRRYTEELWDKTFNDPIVKEKLENRCFLGELGHPADRQEIDIEKVAICLAEYPKKGNDGKLHGVFDILDTPNGRILKTLCDYGCKIGVSSRGGGDTFTDYDGGETVEPDTYECECWDAVVLPAVKEARPVYVTESLHLGKTLKSALQESLNNSTVDERKIMTETLNNLDIDYSTSQEDDTSNEVDNINVVTEEPKEAAEDNGAEMIQELQETLSQNSKFESQIKTLQEKLSVCYTKETRFAETLSKANQELANSKSSNEQLEARVAQLQEQLKKANSLLSERDELIATQTIQLTQLKEHLRNSKSTRQTLTENVHSKDGEIKKLQGTITSLTEDYKKKTSALQLKNDQLQSTNTQLTESLKQAETETKIVKSQANAKITAATELIEKYKSVAKTAIDKYIKSQSVRLGIKPEDIKSRLNENYSFNDIDRVCEDLQRFKLNVNSLPFNMNGQSSRPVKMKITESKESITPTNNDYNVDDDIDDTLKTFI